MTQGIYDTTQPYPRDLIGYGRKPPQAKWPGGARIAVQFVLNYEEGGENAVLHGDPGSEQFLSEMFNPASFPDRHLSMEGIYEYGSRVGVWRLLREFEKRGLPLTVFGVGMALQRHPELTAAFVELGHEIACHGWRWISYQTIDEATEREHMRLGIKAIEDLTSLAPDKPGFGATVAILRAGVMHHVEDEEDEMFPMLRRDEGSMQSIAKPFLEKRMPLGMPMPPAGAMSEGDASGVALPPVPMKVEEIVPVVGTLLKSSMPEVILSV